MKIKEIPILLLTGYLGSGKTTLVNHILSNKRGVKFAVIVNDIGEVNIDADLIQKGGIVDKKDDSLSCWHRGSRNFWYSLPTQTRNSRWLISGWLS